MPVGACGEVDRSNLYHLMALESDPTYQITMQQKIREARVVHRDWLLELRVSLGPKFASLAAIETFHTSIGARYLIGIKAS